MKRTTILLPPALKQRAQMQAVSMGISLGELIRLGLERMLHGTKRKDVLFSDEYVFRGQAPRNISEDHDDYLYGDK